MQYQISYHSPCGFAETIAEAFCDLLPQDTETIRLDRNPTTDAEIHLVGFELGSTNLNTIPYEVISFLEELNDIRIYTLPAKSVSRPSMFAQKQLDT